MVDVDTLNEKFDFVFSSLAFHYIEDFEKLISIIYRVLNDAGVLLFSQEHPIVTAVKNNGDNYIKKLNGSIKGFLLNNYADMSIRKESGLWTELKSITEHSAISSTHLSNADSR